MTALDREMRKHLEDVVKQARRFAELSATAALNVLGAQLSDAPSTSDTSARDLRTALRARAKTLGDGERNRGWDPLVEEIAYEQWHQLLFPRFLAENQLLIHPDFGVPVSLDECAELAPHEGAEDGWVLAVRYASEMLPGLFRADDPAVQLQFAPEGRVRLERLVMELPAEVFIADDALGWVYQYWQAERKAEVNRSGKKIGADELSPVTQLFTENYMVQFLLENSLGAWWAVRHPTSPLLKHFHCLRFRDDGKPAAGSFHNWPTSAAEVTVMDPCCGSGHFLVAAFDMLRQMRMEEENLSEADAGDAVLRDNLYGLELDARCVHIAAFAVALAAWKSGGYRQLPPPKIACSGIPVRAQLEDWLKLAQGDERMRAALIELHARFRDAPILGSLIDPRHTVSQPGVGQQRLLAQEWDRIEKVVEDILRRDRGAGRMLPVLGHDVEELALAANLLGRTYQLVTTNVPYLGRGKQNAELAQFLHENFPEGEDDLATAFVQRLLDMVHQSGALALVTPSDWTSLTSYRSFRNLVLRESAIGLLALLGEEAWHSYGTRGPRTALLVANRDFKAAHNHMIYGIDAATPAGSSPILIREKIELLRHQELRRVAQARQYDNPDERIALESIPEHVLLETFVDSLQGIATADYPWYGRKHWEIPLPSDCWEYQQSTVPSTQEFGGNENVVWWPTGSTNPFGEGSAVRGHRAWTNWGVAVSQMRHLPCALHLPGKFDNNTAVIVPKEGHEDKLPAIWAFCSSPAFNESVRRIDKKKNVTNATLAKVPFDEEHWRRVALDLYPDGLPKPYSNNPTQWLFKGEIVGSTAPLHVAVARLLGYRWSAQQSDTLNHHVDPDGIVPLPAVRGEPTAAERLRSLLADAYGTFWSTAELNRLLEEVGFGDRDLSTWLDDRRGFFAQHCALFDNRPFIWLIWDGIRDGFSALINYHKFTRFTLDRLIYSYLGYWVATQRHLVAAGETGAEARLAAAIGLQEKLLKIREGKPPFDIYARWKPLYEQPIGWDPDINDGVRVNIRSFMTAGVLRSTVSVNWKKDRGSNPAGSDARSWAAEAQQAASNRADLRSFDGSERLNDVYLDLETKRNARIQCKATKGR